MNDLFEKLINKNFNEYKRHLTELITSNEKRFIVITFDNKSFYHLLINKNVEVIADDIGLVKASRFFKNGVKEKVSSVEIVKYLFGSKKKVLLKLLKKLKSKNSKIKVLDFKNDYNCDKDEVFKEKKELKPDL